MVLVSQLAQNQCALRLADVRQYQGHRLVPPIQPAQIGLRSRVVKSGQMHARQHVAHACAMGSRGGKLAVATQAVDHSCRLAFKPVKNLALFVGGRVRYRYAALRQMLHQVQVKGQLLKRQTFKQRQHISATLCVNKVIGVFNAAGATLDGLQFTEIKRFNKVCGFVKRNLGKNGHA